MNFLAIFGAEYLIFIIIILGFGIFIKKPAQIKREMIIFAFFTLPIIFIISRICAALYFNPRPFVAENFTALIPHQSNNGFPSDHTLLSSAIAMIIWQFNRKKGLILLALALMVGLARVYVGVHHYLDIFTSLIISIVAVLFVQQFIWPMVKHYALKK